MSYNKESVAKLIGERVRKLRIENHLTLENLAFNADMDYTQLSRIELGRINTSIFQIHKIAVALGVNTSEILTVLDQ
jgi:transcriptional regulator with XRE-family HTH domain